VGAHADHLGAGLAAADDADHAGAADAGDNVVAAEAFELFRNAPGGAMHVVRKLGMGVQIAAPGGDFILQVRDAIDDRHGFHPCWISKRFAHFSRMPVPRCTAPAVEGCFPVVASFCACSLALPAEILRTTPLPAGAPS